MSGPVYRRTAKVMEAEIGDQLVAFDPKADNCFGFNPVAQSVWRSLQGPKSFDQLRDELLAEYDVDSGQCSVELQQLLDDLLDQGFIEQQSGSSDDARAAPPAGDFPSNVTEIPSAPHAAISRSLSLLVECCRWTFTQNAPVVDTTDWPLFLRLARFHRVQGLVWACLSATQTPVPREVSDLLRADSASIAAANLVAAAESRELLGEFERAGLPLLFVKGLTLGVLAYRNASIKAAVDIDLLVPEDRVVQAAELLRMRGFRLVIPDRGDAPEQVRAWHRCRKESVWSRADVHIDLHTRLSDNPRLISSIGLHSPRKLVEVSSGITLPTLAPDELFAYLCVHGASSAWFRLKWITDLAALLHGPSPEEIERLYERSQELGAGRAAAQALLLADDLYGSLRHTDLRQRLSCDPASRWLAAIALRQVAGRTEPREPTEAFLGTAWIHLSQLRLRPGLPFALSEALRQIRAATA